MDNDLEWSIEPLHLKGCRIYQLKDSNHVTSQEDPVTPSSRATSDPLVFSAPSTSTDFSTFSASSTASASSNSSASSTFSDSSGMKQSISLLTHSRETVEFNKNAATFSRLLDLPVSRVHEVQVIEYDNNSLVKVRYLAMRDKLFNLGYKGEVYVFHGTGYMKNFHAIAEEGFKVGDIDGVPIENGASHGHGVYASLGPDTPIFYSRGTAKVILALGLEGKLGESRTKYDFEPVNTIVPSNHPLWRIFAKSEQLLPVAIITFHDVSPRLKSPSRHLGRLFRSHTSRVYPPPAHFGPLITTSSSNNMISSATTLNSQNNHENEEDMDLQAALMASMASHSKDTLNTDHSNPISGANDLNQQPIEDRNSDEEDRDLQAALMASTTDFIEERNLQLAIKMSKQMVTHPSDSAKTRNNLSSSSVVAAVGAQTPVRVQASSSLASSSSSSSLSSSSLPIPPLQSSSSSSLSAASAVLSSSSQSTHHAVAHDEDLNRDNKRSKYSNETKCHCYHC